METHIEFTLTCEGDVASFNKTALGATLRAQLGCWARDGCTLILNVSAASVLVSGTIVVDDASPVTSNGARNFRGELVSNALVTLLAQSTEELSRSIGVTVETVGEPLISFPEYSALSTVEDADGGLLYFGVAIGGSVLFVTLLVVFRAKLCNLAVFCKLACAKVRCEHFNTCIRRWRGRGQPKMLLHEFDGQSQKKKQGGGGDRSKQHKKQGARTSPSVETNKGLDMDFEGMDVKHV